MEQTGNDPVAVVMSHDGFFRDGRIDFRRWAETVFLPLTLIRNGNPSTIESNDGFREHLEALEGRANALGVAKLKTSLLKEGEPCHGIVLVRTVRQRLDCENHELGKSVITWTLIFHRGLWKISQIAFNDDLYDPSITSQVFG